MRQLNVNEIQNVSGGFPPAVMLVGYVAVRHFGGFAIRAAVVGFISAWSSE